MARKRCCSLESTTSATGKSITGTGVWLMKCLGASTDFSPNQTPLLHRGWLRQLHLFQEIHGLLLDLLPFHDAVLSPLRSTTTLSSAVSFHSNGEVLPGIPQLLQGELVAIDPQQSRQSPCLDFLLPTDPNTAIGRRSFIGKEAALQEGPVGAQPKTPVVLQLLIPHQCTCGTPQSWILDHWGVCGVPMTVHLPKLAEVAWPKLGHPWTHTFSTCLHVVGSHHHTC